MSNVVTFVRSWNTVVSAQKSRNALEEMLRRYGATGFTVSEDYKSRTVVVAFSMPRSFQPKTNEQVEIRLPLSYEEVKRRLNGISAFWKKQEVWKDAQAERVAWRHVLLLTEAALMAAALGVQSLEEAFFAHTMLTLGDGTPTRAIDLVQTVQKRLGSGQ